MNHLLPPDCIEQHILVRLGKFDNRVFVFNAAMRSSEILALLREKFTGQPFAAHSIDPRHPDFKHALPFDPGISSTNKTPPERIARLTANDPRMRPAPTSTV